MFKFRYGILTVATIAAAIVPARAQQSATPPAAAGQADSGQSVAPAGAAAYFVNIKNGDTVTSPFKVIFGLTPNMGVAPSGVEKANVGHHHLLVDTTLNPDELTQPIMVDGQHIHFGKGQTETMVTLPPGKHTLQLQLGDWTHIPFNKPVQSEVISVTVKEETAAANTPADAKAPAEAKASADAKAPVDAKAKLVKPEHHHHRYHQQRRRYFK